MIYQNGTILGLVRCRIFSGDFLGELKFENIEPVSPQTDFCENFYAHNQDLFFWVLLHFSHK